MRKILKLLPDSTRRSFCAPHGTQKDRFDYTGESPYVATEVKGGRLWKVSYDMKMGWFTREKEYQDFKGFSGLDFMSESFEKKLIAGAQTQGDEFVAVPNQDLTTIRYWAEKREKEARKRYQQKTFRRFRISFSTCASSGFTAVR